jgi:hypothetical protein
MFKGAIRTMARGLGAGDPGPKVSPATHRSALWLNEAPVHRREPTSNQGFSNARYDPGDDSFAGSLRWGTVHRVPG